MPIMWSYVEGGSAFRGPEHIQKTIKMQLNSIFNFFCFEQSPPLRRTTVRTTDTYRVATTSQWGTAAVRPLLGGLNWGEVPAGARVMPKKI
jgi:hypothetical protein